MDKVYTILTLSPGSTSTKVAVFRNEEQIFKSNITHETEKLKSFAEIQDQFDYRLETVTGELEKANIKLEDIDAFAAYSGALVATVGGVYPVNDKMLEHSRMGLTAKHPAMLGAQIIYALAQVNGKPAYVINHPDVDELQDLARVTGIPGVYRQSKVHCLNQKETEHRAAAELGIKYEDGNFIVYKNKADGTRAVRYRGTDEAYAVNEIYQKLKAELQEVREHTNPAAQRKMPQRSPQNPYNRMGAYKNYGSGSRPRRRIGCGLWILIIFLGVPIALALISSILQALGLYTPPPSNGYYSYGGQEYRYEDDSWYAYDDDFGWYYTDVDPYLADNYNDYWDSSSDPYGSTYGGDNSYSYSDDNNWDDDWDDDDWDWDDDEYGSFGSWLEDVWYYFSY